MLDVFQKKLCIMRLCTPNLFGKFLMSYMIIYSDHADYGFDVTVKGFNWSKIQESRDAYVRRLNGIYETNLKNVSLLSIVIIILFYSLA